MSSLPAAQPAPRLSLRIARAFALFAVICAAFVPLSAQTPDQFANLATQVADAVVASHEERILLAPVQGCVLDSQLCAAADAALRDELNKRIQKVQMAGREQILPFLRPSCLLQIDAYNEWVLQRLIEKTPSRLLITENLKWQPDGYKVVCEVTDIRKHKGLGAYSANISFSAPDSNKSALIFREPDSPVALVVERTLQDMPFIAGKGRLKFNPANEGHPMPHPRCVECSEGRPLPTSEPEEDLVLLYTVTDNGTVEGIVVVHPIDPQPTAEMIKSVAHWQFKPAVGPDGTPFATREIMLQSFFTYR
jgi:hypothetical protein